MSGFSGRVGTRVSNFFSNALREDGVKPEARNDTTGGGGGGDTTPRGGNGRDFIEANGDADLDALLDKPLGAWDNTPPEDKNKNKEGNNSGGNGGNSDTGKKPGEDGFDFNKYITEKKFGDNVQIPKEQVDKLLAGDLSVLPDVVRAIARGAAEDAYRHGMIDNQNVLKNKLDAAVEQAVTRSDGSRRASEVVNMMNTALPFTKDPDIKPVADALLSQQIKNGKSPEDSIKIITAFFKRTSGLTARSLEDNGPPGNGGFSGRRGGGESVENADWFAALTGGQG